MKTKFSTTMSIIFVILAIIRWADNDKTALYADLIMATIWTATTHLLSRLGK
jgi:hypothetical protein